MRTVLAASAAVYTAYGPLPAAAARLKNWASPPRGGGEKVLFLTFDDGPDPAYTPQLLDLLAGHHIRASFFVVGEFAAAYPDLVERAAGEGHLIGLHSCSHRCALLMGPGATRGDIARSAEILQVLGLSAGYYRAPWGLVNLSMQGELARRGMQAVFWDVMAEDWRGDTTPQIIAGKLLRRVRSGSVVCLHDGRGKNGAPARTIEALRSVLPVWEKEGYRFLRIDES